MNPGREAGIFSENPQTAGKQRAKVIATAVVEHATSNSHGSSSAHPIPQDLNIPYQ